MAPKDPIVKRVRALCLALPDTEESLSFGKPHYKVAGKIFSGCDDHAGSPRIGFKLEKAAAAALIAKDPRCTPAPYVGKHGWVSMELKGRIDWNAVQEFLLESYRLIAPKASRAKLDAIAAPPKSSAARAPRAAARRKPASRGRKAKRAP